MYVVLGRCVYVLYNIIDSVINLKQTNINNKTQLILLLIDTQVFNKNYKDAIRIPSQ